MYVSGFSRRALLRYGALAATANIAQRTGFAADCSPVVKTSFGALRGECEPGVRVFRGVPFAAPPIGDLRFRAPSKALPWTAERDATRFAAASLQPAKVGFKQSEDCLYLNLWVPEGKGPFPVFVWIHGGGFTAGHAFEPIYDGTQFAQQGIICVTVAYRLGVLGFLDVEPMLGATYSGSANNGLRDLVEALTWVKEHIADFGGDPTKVTIGGESAGAKLTDILMGVDAARPLFSQMISESGGAERVWPHVSAQAVGAGFAEKWRLSSGGSDRDLLFAPGEALLKAQEKMIFEWPQHFPLRPEIDRQLLPRLPIASIEAGSTKGKRLLIGTNRDESALFVGPHPSYDATAADLGNISVPEFAAFYAHYGSLYPELSVERRRIRALTAEEYWIPTLRVAEAHASSGGAAWMYRMDFAEERGRLATYAFHSLDIPLVWDKPHKDVGNDAEEATLALMIHNAWVSFLKGTAPNAIGLPAWPPFDEATRKTMLLDVHCRVEERPAEAERLLWKDWL